MARGFAQIWRIKKRIKFRHVGMIFPKSIPIYRDFKSAFIRHICANQRSILFIEQIVDKKLIISGISPKTYLVPIASAEYSHAPRNCVALLGESPFGLVRQDLSTLENNARFAM